jgi:hypothetical protein
MNWQQFLTEGDKAVKIVRDGLRKRNINAGEPILTIFNTDEDVPIYDNNRNKLFWISVKSVSGYIQDPITQIPSNYKGWMCGEVESRQWVNPPAVIIWYCLNTNVAWGAITPKRLSTKWIIFPDRYGIVIDKRKTILTGENHYLYPSYCVPKNEIMTKNQTIDYIKNLIENQ